MRGVSLSSASIHSHSRLVMTSSQRAAMTSFSRRSLSLTNTCQSSCGIGESGSTSPCLQASSTEWSPPPSAFRTNLRRSSRESIRWGWYSTSLSAALPSCPLWPTPHEKMSPVWLVATVWVLPAPTERKRTPSTFLLQGTVTSTRRLETSRPVFSPLPQVMTLPSRMRAIVWNCPPHRLTTFLSNRAGISVRRSTVLVLVLMPTSPHELDPHP
mmetsp:Transcript_24053/g.69342  ORF Transcript_24053/g.69342 Transcript_24053/m.69342 type:complete len:213 (-) Transcript_24053:63-701(-)